MFKKMSWPAKWLMLCLEGDRLTAPSYLERDLKDLSESVQEIEIRAAANAKRRREALLNPPPKQAPRLNAPPFIYLQPGTEKSEDKVFYVPPLH